MMRSSTPLHSQRLLRLVLSLALIGATAAISARAQESFIATHFAVLDGASEMPAVENAGTGIAIMKYDPAANSLEYRITVVLPPGDSLTAAHFHRGLPGQNGSPVHVIKFLDGQWTATGTWTSISPDDMQALLAGGIYVNVHTNTNPNGQLRAQVAPIPNLSAQELSPAMEVPAVSGSNGTGKCGIWLDPTLTRAYYHLEWDSLSAPPVGAHFHRASKGTNGPVVKAIDLPSSPANSGTADGVWDGLTADDVTDLRSGRFYVNIHTSNNPNGEVRGQIYTNEVFTAAISAGNEEPPVTASKMMGTGMALVQGDGQISGIWLIGRAPATNAHIHMGAKGVNGDVVFELAGLGGLIWFRLPDGSPIANESWEAFRNGGMYVNFHTQDVPTGEARGQLIPAAGNIMPLVASVPSLEPDGGAAVLTTWYVATGGVRFNLAADRVQHATSVRIFSSLGRLIASAPVTEGSGLVATGALPAGVYFVQLLTDGAPTGFSRFVVVR